MAKKKATKKEPGDNTAKKKESLGDKRSRKTTRKAKRTKKSTVPEKPTKASMEQRISFTANLLVQGLYKHQIKEALRKEFGVSPRTMETYLARAREILKEEASLSREQMRAESYARCLSVMQKQEARPQDILRAQERIDSVFGLTAPKRIAVTDTDGNDINSPEALERLQAIADSLDDGAGEVGEAGY